MKSFRKYIVSLYCVTSSATLNSLSQIIGIECSPSSHERGAPHPKGRVWDKTHWKLESSLPSSSDLDHHIDDIFGRLSVANVKKAVQQIGDMDVYLDVAVITDLVACSVSLPIEIISTLQELGAAIEVTFYSGTQTEAEAK